MSIATELTALQTDITNAREAIVNKGGTVTAAGGSSQLANDINTIPSGAKDIVAYHGYMLIAPQTAAVMFPSGVRVYAPATGRYKVSWVACRSDDFSGSVSSRLYVNGTAVDSEHSIFIDNQWQSVIINNLSLTKDDLIEVYVSSSIGGSGYSIVIANLIVEKQATSIFDTAVFYLDAKSNSTTASEWHDSNANIPFKITSDVDISTPGKAVFTSSGISTYKTASPYYYPIHGTGDFTLVWAGNVTQLTQTPGAAGGDSYSMIATQTPQGQSTYNTGRWQMCIVHGGSDDGKFRMWCNDGTSTGVNSNNVVTLGKHVFCAVRRSGTVYLYIDNVLVGSGAFNKDINKNYLNNTMVFSIGVYQPDNKAYVAKSWEFYAAAIFDKSLTTDELTEVYTDLYQRYMS